MSPGQGCSLPGRSDNQSRARKCTRNKGYLQHWSCGGGRKQAFGAEVNSRDTIGDTRVPYWGAWVQVPIPTSW